MGTITQNRAPFNSSYKRFGKLVLHPNLDVQGLFVQRPPASDPCYYNPIRIQDLCRATHKKKDEKDPWRYKTELEDWSANLGYRNQKYLAQRRWIRSLLGPAWYTVSEPSQYKAACPNVGFGRTSRDKPSKSFTPGPGSYYTSKPYKAPYGPHSTRPTFDREEPCRFKDMSPKWSLAPNRYTIIDRESIAEKPNKLVSRRGPYDLFSGKRIASKQKCTAATWPYNFKGCFETYKKSHLGEMNKTGRDKPHRGRNTLVDISMCIRKPADPGPAHYGIKPTEFKKNKKGFNSSYDRPPGYVRVIVWPGVGRYRIVQRRTIPGQGHRHVFTSKVGRTIGAVIPEPMNTF